MTDTLRRHQMTMLKMLKDVDAVCRKYGIRYMLFAGTALGAVRHQGFIPWDDDLDIIMLREEYDRFFAVAAKELDADQYYVQQEFSPHWPMQFSKIRLNGTTCMEKYHPRDKEVHQGIYIDIFPCDNLSDHALIRGLQFVASKVVIAKALYARGYATDSILKKCFMQICRLLPRKPFWSFCVRRKDIASHMVHSFFGASSRYAKSIYPREWFTNTVDMPFENSVFPVSAQFDELLTTLYGDYMTLPSPEQRKSKQHVALLDLDCPYTAYLAEQKDMCIDTYTRSIR